MEWRSERIVLIMKVSDILYSLNKWAPLVYQESYDNAGLLVGEPDTEVKGVLICLDITEDIIQEAQQCGCNLIISHHPIIFGGMKRLTGRSPEERIVMQALRQDICLMAMHTNLDNMYIGVNAKIAERIGLEQTQILQPMDNILRKLSVFVPSTHIEQVQKAVFGAGAGHIGQYDCCGFQMQGQGSYRPLEGATPFLGAVGKLEAADEIRFETIYPKHVEYQVLEALLEVHPYEEVAYDIYPLSNTHQQIGAGMWGYLPNPMSEKDFLQRLKDTFEVGAIKHTAFRGKPIHKVAFCGGSGSFLINKALALQADIYFTGDIKYHDFFKANKQTILADIGHYESEQFTKQLISDFLQKQNSEIQCFISGLDTNPINWF